MLCRSRIQRTVSAHHGLGVPHNLLQVGKTGTVFTGIASAQRAGSRDLGGGAGASSSGTVLEGSEEGLDGLGGQVLVVVVVDLDHGGVNAGTQALDLDIGEEAVLGGVAGGDAEVLVDSLDNSVGTATTKLAGGL